MVKKVAVIDLGTNTFNILIATVGETQFTTIFHDKEGVALGMGGINQNKIAPEAISRALTTLKAFKSQCDKHQVAIIHAFGTSAIRNASNGNEFCQLVEKEVGIKIKVITGLEEANLIYKGVLWSYDFSSPAVIMDIGGGSTEFVLANQQGVQSSVSLDIGVSRMYQQLQLSDPLTKEDEETIINRLENKSNNQLEALKTDIIIGSSGVFETVYEVFFDKRVTHFETGLTMEKSVLFEALDKIIASTLSERQLNPLIIPIRQLMLPIAAVKIKWIMEKLAAEKLIISPYSLKEGALKLN